MPAKKQKTISQLKKELWKHFSKYIKLKYSTDGYTNCYTCDKLLQLGTADCQGGHWLAKGVYSIHYFNEDNVRPQCSYCNKWRQGMPVEFEERLRRDLGDEVVDDLLDTRWQDGKKDRFWYEDKIKEYKEKVKDYE